MLIVERRRPVARDIALGYGRFLQMDPLGYEDGPNAYDYAHGDPVNGTDPTGTVTIAPHADGGQDEAAKEFWAIVASYDGNVDWHAATNPQAAFAEWAQKAIAEMRSQQSHMLPGASVTDASNSDEIVVNGPHRVPDSQQFYFNGVRYVANPYFSGSPVAFDYAFGAMFVGPALIPIAIETGAVAIETESVGFANYGRRTKWQVRLFKDFLAVRRDVMKPDTHVNLQGNFFGYRFNFHLPF